MPGWYYLDGTIWTPFDATISSELERIFQSSSASGQFADFTVDFHTMSLKRHKKRNKILIKRADMTANPSHAWEWEMNGVWHPFDFFDSDFLCVVESKPHLGTTVLYLGPSNQAYEIDTRSCTQRNLKTSYRRSLRKVPIIAPPAPSTTAASSSSSSSHATAPPAVAAPAPSTSSSSSSVASPAPAAPAPAAATTTSPTKSIAGASAATPAPAPASIDLTGVPSAIRGVILSCTRLDCNEDCVICMEPFDDINGVAHALPDCTNHGFHLECIKNQLISQGKCPICNKIYLINEGTQPKNGTMSVQTNGHSLPGHPRCGTIVINYNFPSGIQGPEHPNPGMRFSGTSRTAYLPDNAEGREVLELLKQCFEKRLIFTVGRSVTTGQDNCVVWNGIHHKTNTTGGASHFGYPDDTYLTRVKHELSAKGFS